MNGLWQHGHWTETGFVEIKSSFAESGARTTSGLRGVCWCEGDFATAIPSILRLSSQKPISGQH